MYRLLSPVLSGLWKKPAWRGVVLGIVCALVAWFVTRLSVLHGLEEWLQDGAFSLRSEFGSKLEPRTRVIIIGVDDPSLDDLNKPRLFISPEIARVVRFVKDQGASAIGIDMIIPAKLMQLNELQAGGKGDAVELGLAIQEAGNRVVLASWETETLQQWQLKHHINPGDNDFGFVNITPDKDSFVRRQELVGERDGREHRHFALALVSTKFGWDVEWTDDRLLLGKQVVPLDEEGKLRINYVGPPGTFPEVSLKEALAAAKGESKWPERAPLAKSIVIIGITAKSQQDFHPTPFTNNYWRPIYSEAGELTSGPELHANIVATLADSRYIHALSPPASLAMLVVFGAVLGRVFAFLSLTWGFVLAGVHHWAWKLLCFASLAWLSWRVDIVPMLTLGILIYGVTFLQRWWTLRQMLGVVKSEAIARLLENDPGQLDLRGEERIVTVLFADVRNFTDYSEKHAAREVMTLLNRYYAEVVPIVEKHGDTLAAYMGDGIMVLFGAPAALPDHALQAVRTAAAMVRRVHELAAVWAEHDCPGFRIGAGIHTGTVVAGTVGSRRRLDYTVIGDTVNSAARIEAVNKEFHSEILISAQTFHELPAKARQELGCAAEPRTANVKGREQPLFLHEVKPRVADAVPANLELAS